MTPNPTPAPRSTKRLSFAFVLSFLVFFSALPLVHAEPSDTATVYLLPGKKRIHVPECRRYKRLGEEEKATAESMTYGEAKAKGLALCTRCPGTTTAKAPASKQDSGSSGDLPESWVNPAPSDVTKVPFVPSPRAPLVTKGDDGRLVYKPYSDKGDRIADFSYVGYKKSEVPIPNVRVVETLEPLSGETLQDGTMKYPMGPDSRARIQAALDKVAAMSPDADGIRGAVLLKQGTYYIDGPLKVGSGVVLRGEGDGADGTVLIMQSSGSSKEVAISLTGAGGVEPVGADNAVRITDAYVPTGSMRVTLADAGAFQAGDFVEVRKTTNQQWIDDLGMGERLRHIRGGKEGAFKKPWRYQSYQFRILRQITAVNGNSVTFDIPLPQSFDPKHGGGEVYKVDYSQAGYNGGIESLRIVSNFDTATRDTGKDANFRNFHTAIRVSNYRDGWVRNVTALHMSFAAAATAGGSRQITIRDSKYLEPVGPKRGGFRYSFTISGGTGHLFYRCYSEDARHCFSAGSREQGPFVFLDCTSLRGGQSEPHHRWGTGFLYDNVSTVDGTLAAINRGDSGSGHGWAAANTLFWNCNAKNIVVMDPETEGENNFAIGFTGDPTGNSGTGGLMYANTRAGYWGTPYEGKYYGFPSMGSGHIESPDAPVEPRSLFKAQLIERIGEEKAMRVLE